MRSNFLWVFIAVIIQIGAQLSATAQQTRTVTGKVTDDRGEPVIGAVVTVKNNTSIGTTTSATGDFRLNVPAGTDSLTISALNYTKTTVAVAETMNITLAAGSSELSEVVVVGYGTQRKGDLTAPITTVNTEDMLKRTTSMPMDAIQGAAPGVQVISSGAPGSTPTVRVRGIGAFANSNPLYNSQNPLYVVDGMFTDDISFLNPNDIAELSILKDASGAAIYGVRAANGVILITTKKGRLNMAPRVTYNAFVGYQIPTNVIQMANGEQFAKYALQWRTPSDSGSIRESANLYGGSGLNPTTNTDWYSAILRDKALITNHSIDLNGGGEKITYSLGANYIYQDGIMNAKNDFQRYNIRFQVEMNAFDWLKFGVTSTLSNSTMFRPDNVAFLTAYTASPLFPVYDEEHNPNAFPVKFGNSASIGRSDPNAVAQAYYNYNRYKFFQVLPTVYAEVNLWSNKISIRTQLNQLYASGLETIYDPRINLGLGSDNVAVSHLSSKQDRRTNYIWDNLLTYRDGKGKSNWSILLGQSARQEQWRSTTVQADNVPAQEEYWYVGRGTQAANYYSEDGIRNTGLSFFTRGTYDYDNRYLLTATFRRDGSSKYQEKWGNFPSIGLGWVISRENFMRDQQVLSFLKLRGSWGKLGNDGVSPNAGYAVVSTGNNFSGIFGNTSTTNGEYVPGYTVNNFYANISWEVVTEWDGGIDFEFMHGKLKGSADYFTRKTTGAALSRPFAFGAPDIYGNWADMKNSGFEVALNWNDKVGKFSYQVGGNISTLKNEVTNIGTSLANISGGYSEWMAEFPNRIAVGAPIQYFYGYDVVGVYQSQHEVDTDPMAVHANGLAAGSVMPGHFKYRDVNGNGMRDDGDRINLGSYLPKVTYGLNASFSYANVDFSIALQGVGGNKIHNLNRGRFVKAQAALNLDQEFIESLWTGEGSTNKYPSAYALTQAWNKPGSSFFVENGAYLRIQNIQLGYNFKLNNNRSPINLRVFATADRPLIFTKYSGFTPEVSGLGYDAQVYPIASTYSLGLRAAF